MDFNLGDTDYEAGVEVYDSGGGTFVKDGGVWKLAGINTSTYRSSLLTTPSDAVDRTFSISIPAHTNWITQMIDSVTGDADSDGIPNWWEEQFGTTTGLVASADNDGDTVNNYDEYIADTNPTNAASFFEIDSFVALTNQTITFTGSTVRQYQLFYTTNDLAATNLVWNAAHTNLIWGAGTHSSITVTNADEKNLLSFAGYSSLAARAAGFWW